MKFLISNVKEDRKYKGAYAKIFKILNGEAIFLEAYYETDESEGYNNGSYTLEINDTPDAKELDLIKSIKNVKVISL